MSVKVMSWVWEHSHVDGSDRLVLLALADHADHDGSGARPGIDRLCRKTRLKRRTVYDCLRRLEARGALRVERRGGGASRPAIYRVLMDRPATGDRLPPNLPNPEGTADGGHGIQANDANRTDVVPARTLLATAGWRSQGSDDQPPCQLDAATAMPDAPASTNAIAAPVPAPKDAPSRTSAAGRADDEECGQAHEKVRDGAREGAASRTPIEEEPSGTVRNRPASGGAGARRLVASYVASCPHRPPERVLGQLGRHVAELLAEDIPAWAIEQGLSAFRHRDVHPAALPSLVDVALRGGTPGGRPRLGSRAPQPTADVAARAARLARELAARRLPWEPADGPNLEGGTDEPGRPDGAEAPDGPRVPGLRPESGVGA